MTLTLGIDLGTSGIKAVILEDAARVVASAAHPVAVSIPHLGWSEQDPDLWVSTVWHCLDDLAASHPREMAAVTGIGLSGQMLACLILGADLKPLRPAMLWNDQRAIAECAELLARVPDIGNRTNLFGMFAAIFVAAVINDALPQSILFYFDQNIWLLAVGKDLGGSMNRLSHHIQPCAASLESLGQFY